MPNYTNSKIYKIVSPSRPDIPPYFGATTQQLSVRMGGHRRIQGNPCKSKSLIECGDAIIILVENYPCNSKEELDRKEAEYILNNDCCNKVIPLRTQKQYNQDNKEQLAEQKKQYYQDNREEFAEKHKKYYQDNREQLAEYKKQYYQDKREQIAEKMKKYNEEQIEEQKRRKNIVSVR